MVCAIHLGKGGTYKDVTRYVTQVLGAGGVGGGIFLVRKGSGHVLDILQRGTYLDCVHVSKRGVEGVRSRAMHVM